MAARSRKPQINFQVEDPMKQLYEETKARGITATRLCAAGFLLMVEDAAARQRAINRLLEWEEQFADASAEEIREFVTGLQDAAQSAARGSGPGRAAQRGQKKATRS